MSLTDTLNNTAGRFTTLVVGSKKDNVTFCAQILSASKKTVSFYDVNADADRRVPTSKIISVKSGKIQYAKA
jgi:hypothetical protein